MLWFLRCWEHAYLETGPKHSCRVYLPRSVSLQSDPKGAPFSNGWFCPCTNLFLVLKPFDERKAANMPSRLLAKTAHLISQSFGRKGGPIHKGNNLRHPGKILLFSCSAQLRCAVPFRSFLTIIIRCLGRVYSVHPATFQQMSKFGDQIRHMTADIQAKFLVWLTRWT
ncbi:hypothetical protein BC567DRAFT_71757 [Phyllosticta citribraziliensis]